MTGWRGRYAVHVLRPIPGFGRGYAMSEVVARRWHLKAALAVGSQQTFANPGQEVFVYWATGRRRGRSVHLAPVQLT